MNFVWTLSLLCCGLALVGNALQRIPVQNSYDPGSCNKNAHGKEILVKDRTEEEVILICVKREGVYQWKSTDGKKNTVGEFFNPGDDCTDILDELEDAKDGAYWIKSKRSYPEKVWCDMNVDGGGFMLVGRKNNSITWTVPSSNVTVEPFGQPHWSSSLGEVPILDFRVQIAVREDFKATKGDWSYRLRSRRPLKKLMVNTAGCDQRSAGIGDIAYVKDIQTGRIITTGLRCSKFGFAYHPLAKLGWHKMNSCLQSPCPWGFAFPDEKQNQVDFSGGFSFSTTESISGMEYKATAFVGCDNGHCCGCFGPLGGTNNYCAENCKAINGGTVTKNVFTWLWVRSSLPKKLWKKCMDYEVRRDDGKSISYKLVGHSVLPVQGDCGKQSTLLHDGIVVVPDSSAALKVPAVDGLLEFRKDNQELYIRSNKTWNVLAQEKKILKKTTKIQKINSDEITKLQQILDNQTKIINQLKSAVKKFEDFVSLPQHEECFQYQWLKESYRNENFTTIVNKCYGSVLPTGWYRFGGAAGTKMAGNCVPSQRCGGNIPGWLNGTHPSVADGKVGRKVCFRYPHNCCMYSTTIQVVNCGLYYIYKLHPFYNCNFNYCSSYY